MRESIVYFYFLRSYIHITYSEDKTYYYLSICVINTEDIHNIFTDTHFVASISTTHSFININPNSYMFIYKPPECITAEQDTI